VEVWRAAFHVAGVHLDISHDVENKLEDRKLALDYFLHDGATYLSPNRASGGVEHFLVLRLFWKGSVDFRFWTRPPNYYFLYQPEIGMLKQIFALKNAIFCDVTRRRMPEDGIPHSHRRENLNSKSASCKLLRIKPVEQDGSLMENSTGETAQPIYSCYYVRRTFKRPN
jgi:hypothetical protein